MSDIQARVAAVIARQLKIDAARVRPEATFRDDLGADSLAVVELILAMEAEFGFSIPDDQAEKIRTVNDAVSYIQARAA